MTESLRNYSPRDTLKDDVGTSLDHIQYQKFQIISPYKVCYPKSFEIFKNNHPLELYVSLLTKRYGFLRLVDILPINLQNTVFQKFPPTRLFEKCAWITYTVESQEFAQES